MNYGEICKQVIVVAKDVGNFIRQQLQKVNNNDVETKGKHDFVTYVDKTSEQLLTKGLSAILPGSGFIAEENTVDKKNSDYVWIVDPLDGTTNFIHKVPCFSVSIALQVHNELVIGVIYEINLDECFWAWKGGGAFLNGVSIKVSSTTKLDDALLATGFPYYDYSKMNEYIELFKYFMQNSRGLRRLGSAAVDLAYVACGRFDGFYEYSLKPWDVAAGVVIVQEAGGKVFDFAGGDKYLFGQEIVACNANIEAEMKAVVKDYFNKI